jgi:hypothetical protein
MVMGGKDKQGLSLLYAAIIANLERLPKSANNHTNSYMLGCQETVNLAKGLHSKQLTRQL